MNALINGIVCRALCGTGEPQIGIDAKVLYRSAILHACMHEQLHIETY